MTTTKKDSTRRHSATKHNYPSNKRISITVPRWVRTVYVHSERGNERCGGSLVALRVA